MSNITYTKNSSIGNMINSLVNGTIQMQFLAQRIRNILLLSLEDDPKFIKVEERFGLPPGQGKDFVEALQEIYYSLSSIKALSKLDLG